MRKNNLINHLIYPVPNINGGGLGIHATLDLGGGIRLGPDDCYIDRDKIDCNVDISKRKNFLISVNKFLLFLEEDDLIPDLAGIRPKLQGKNEDFRDFIISEESKLGFRGFINLIGIESPRLTSAPAKAKIVTKRVKEAL